MRLIRRFEEVAFEQFERGEVPGPLHLAIGQEAVAVGACWLLRPTDVILSTHRGHHHILAKGARPDRLMAELLGRCGGYSRGRGGSMHIAIPELGILGTNGVVGGGLPIAPGAAYGLVAQERDDVVICFFGEGAAATGAFGEALNISSLWSLPVIFICENNQYVELTPSQRHVAGEISKRADGYDMPGQRVNASDLAALVARVGQAVDRARRGDGPSLIEVHTYRWTGHYAADKAAYRPEGELREWQERDALVLAQAALDTAVVDRMDAAVEAEIGGALEFAVASDPVKEDALWADHYAKDVRR